MATQQNQRSLLRFGLAIVVAGGCAWGATEAVRFMTTGETLPVRTIAVKGAPEGRANEIRAYANVHVGAPLLGVDLDAVSARVKEHPFVRAASSRRVPPDAIEIEVVARRPAALLSAGGLYLVDDAGHPFKRARPGDGLDLPVISGDVLVAKGLADEESKSAHAARVDVRVVQKALLGVDAVLRNEDVASVLGRLEEVNVQHGFGLALVFSSGVRARIGDGLLDSKLSRMVRVVRRLRAAGHDPAELYLDDGRRPERVAVRLRPVSEVAPDTGS